MINGIYFILFSILAIPLLVWLLAEVVDIILDDYFDNFGPF